MENIEQLQPADASVIKDPRLMRALRLLHSRYKDENFEVCEISRRLGCATSTIRVLFRNELATNPLKYLCRIGLYHMIVLLRENSNLAIKEAMAQSGFSDPSHFHGIFKQYFGVTPKNYRAQTGLLSPDA